MQNAALDHDLENGDSAHPTTNHIDIAEEIPSTNVQTEQIEHSATHVNGNNEDSQVAQNEDVAAPARSLKKRKFDELNPRSRSTSRAVSPPWKKFEAEGPTQFTDNGKRRSGRVNHIPLELQPPSDKRTTRAANESSASAKVSKRSSKLKKEYEATPTKATTIKVERRTSAGGKAAVTDAGQPKQSFRSSRLEEKNKEALKSKAEAQAALETTDDQVKDETVEQDSIAPTKRKPGRPSNASKLAQATSPEARTTRDRRLSQEVARNTHASPRLRLKLPAFVIQPRHPGYIPNPSPFSSIDELLAHFDRKEKEHGDDRDNEPRDELERKPVEKVKRTSEEEALAEAEARRRVLKAAKPGGVLSEERSSLYFPDVQGEPPIQYGHSNHLWAHGRYFRELLSRERAKHMDMAKKTAYACLAKWKERQPQTEEEKQQQEIEHYRLIYKQTVRDMKLKWDMITSEIERRRLAQWVEEQELTRDRKMQRLLEDATKLMDRRRSGYEELDSPMADESEQSEDDASDTDRGSRESGDDGLSDDEGDDDNMTSSDSGTEDADSLAGDDDDANLSPEALRAKYANLPDQEALLEGDRSDDDDGAEPDDDVSMLDATAEPSVNGELDQADAIDVSNVVLEEVDEALLDDEDDESTNMSDEDMSSEEDESDNGSDGSAEEDNESEEEDTMGLMGFLGGKERLQLQQDGPKRVIEQPQEDTDTPQNAEAKGSHVEASESVVDQDVIMQEGPVPESNHLSTTLADGDHSSQPTPMNDSTAAPTETESTTTMDLTEIKSQIMPTLEETQAAPQITTKIPSLLRGTLREYQHYGLDWLAKLYANQTNGILADEMGLGKTIQTISLLAHLAEEHEVWGPHLIVVPTSVILNWEMEFKKFLPGFKILSYYGTAEERKEKRKGWSNPDKYNVVITSYQLVLKDLNSIRVPEWHYMILDEAHNIKNFQSQRYQAMIRLKTHARLLLTGTPLQNSIQELWSLLTFLTAGQDGQGMGDLDEFTQWFKRPVDEIFVDGKNKLGIEAQEIVNKLHHSLRPYILRRMKAQVEKQLPAKYEHTVFCRLSKRQRQLYDAFLGRTDVKEKLSSGNPISVSQALMALRKVCNHPDLFEERPIVTSFTMRKPFSKMPRSVAADFEIKDLLVRRQLAFEDQDNISSLIETNFNVQGYERYSQYGAKRTRHLAVANLLRHHLHHQAGRLPPKGAISGSSFEDTLLFQHRSSEDARLDKLQRYISLTDMRSGRTPAYGCDLIASCTIYTNDRLRVPIQRTLSRARQYALKFEDFAVLPDMVPTIDRRTQTFMPEIKHFTFVTPNAVAHDILPYSLPEPVRAEVQMIGNSSDPDAFHESRVRQAIAFPDKRLLQYDCGKLQQLAILLRNLQSKGSRALIFTQMTLVLDILEQFLNIHGYRYMRLDGSTRIEQRQDMMERFNRDTRIDVFILSSRSGGIGMNLTGADTVIFYDLDWNPQMDKQCQDRAHRIGQTRDVHIYKLVSEHTIEVNILKKSNQKRMLDEVVIQEGEFTTDYFNKAQAEDDMYVADDEAGAAVDRVLGLERKGDMTKVLAGAEDEVDVQAAQAQQREAYVDDADFNFDSKQRGRSSKVGTSAPPTIDNPHDIVGDVDMDEEEQDPEVLPHVDEYMLGFVELMLKDVPFVPPLDKKKARLDKNGRDRSHRPRKAF
ncbi:hypothetical protein MBLNU457_2184t1 [Dothideomycetes sp. NU457]